MKHKEEGINISHVNIENMGGRDQSRVKIKFKKFEKVKSIPKTYQKVITMTDVIIDVALSHHQSCCIAVTRYVSVVYNVCPSMPIHHFAPLFHSTTTSNNLSLKVKVCHRYNFLVRLWNGLNFFKLFKLYFHLGLIMTPHVFYVHMTYVYSFLMFHSSHDHMAKRSHYRIMIFSTSEYY